jgi:hypothetical protein
MSPAQGSVSAKFAQGLIVAGHNSKPGMNYVLIKEMESIIVETDFHRNRNTLV